MSAAGKEQNSTKTRQERIAELVKDGGRLFAEEMAALKKDQERVERIKRLCDDGLPRSEEQRAFHDDFIKACLPRLNEVRKIGDGWPVHDFQQSEIVQVGDKKYTIMKGIEMVAPGYSTTVTVINASNRVIQPHESVYYVLAVDEMGKVVRLAYPCENEK